jgi:cytochrome b pre-mRNA-processing protein 3
MNNKYINIYNRLVNLTRNKDLYKDFIKQDTFSDRLIFLLLHFAFFLKVFKKDNDKKVLQEIYDFFFRQLELSIREIGYGDQSINKKMKNYINLFYSMIEKVDKWDNLESKEKRSILSTFLNSNIDTLNLLDYFEKYSSNLSNNTLNFYIKGVSNL